MEEVRALNSSFDANGHEDQEIKMAWTKWASTAAPLYVLLRIRNRIKAKDAHFVQDYWKLLSFPFCFDFFVFSFWFFLFSFFLFFWIFLFLFFLDFSFFLSFIFLILKQSIFFTFHHTRVFLPSPHRGILIFQLYCTSVSFWILPHEF